MDRADQHALEVAVAVLADHGREAAEYLAKLLEAEENDEAAAWLKVLL